MANKKKERWSRGHKANNWKMWNFLFHYYCDSTNHGIKNEKKNADIALISIYACRGHNSWTRPTKIMHNNSRREGLTQNSNSQWSILREWERFYFFRDSERREK